MKKALILDKLGKCRGCAYETPGPSKILTASPCTWCERNPFLMTEVSDNFQKMEIPKGPTPEDLDTSSLPNDYDPAYEANKKLLADEWGINLKPRDHSKKNKKRRGS